MEYGNEEVLSEICVLCMKYEYKEFISEIRILWLTTIWKFEIPLNHIIQNFWTWNMKKNLFYCTLSYSKYELKEALK